MEKFLGWYKQRSEMLRMYIFQKSNWNKEMLNPLVSQDFCFISRSRISYFQVNEIQCFAYLLFLSWPGKCKQKTYLNSRNICNFCPLCSGTGWSSLEASVIRERERDGAGGSRHHSAHLTGSLRDPEPELLTWSQSALFTRATLSLQSRTSSHISSVLKWWC